MFNLPTCQQVWGSFCGLLVLQHDRWKVARSVKLLLLTHGATVQEGKLHYNHVNSLKEGLNMLSPKHYLHVGTEEVGGSLMLYSQTSAEISKFPKMPNMSAYILYTVFPFDGMTLPIKM